MGTQMYTLRVGKEVKEALDKVGRNKVRDVLCKHFGVEHTPMKRGRPRKVADAVGDAEEVPQFFWREDPITGSCHPLGYYRSKGDALKCLHSVGDVFAGRRAWRYDAVPLVDKSGL